MQHTSRVLLLLGLCVFLMAPTRFVPPRGNVIGIHSTDCSAETGAATDDVCFETSGAGLGLWRCPSPGDCGGTTSWVRVDASGLMTSFNLTDTDSSPTLTVSNGDTIIVTGSAGITVSLADNFGNPTYALLMDTGSTNFLTASTTPVSNALGMQVDTDGDGSTYTDDVLDFLSQEVHHLFAVREYPVTDGAVQAYTTNGGANDMEWVNLSGDISGQLDNVAFGTDTVSGNELDLDATDIIWEQAVRIFADPAGFELEGSNFEDGNVDFKLNITDYPSRDILMKFQVENAGNIENWIEIDTRTSPARDRIVYGHSTGTRNMTFKFFANEEMLLNATALKVPVVILGDEGIETRNGTTSAGFLDIFEDEDSAGDFKTRITVGNINDGEGANIDFILPVDEGDPNEILATDGSGVLSWVTKPPSGDITAILNCTIGDCDNMVPFDTSGIDWTNVDPTVAGEGIILPQNAGVCTAATDVGQICWDNVNDDLYVGDGSAAVQMNAAAGAHSGTITWGGTAILESGTAFQFGDASDATVTHTYGNTGTNNVVAYSSAVINWTTGELQQGGSAVLLDSDLGGSVQAQDDELDTIAALIEAEGAIIIGNATPAWSVLVKGDATAILVADGTTAAWDTTPELGTPSALVLTNATLLPSSGIVDEVRSM